MSYLYNFMRFTFIIAFTFSYYIHNREMMAYTGVILICNTILEVGSEIKEELRRVKLWKNEL